MFVVLRKDTYAGDGCASTSDYSVSAVIGSFTTTVAADEWIVLQTKSYSVDYEVFEVEDA